MYKTCYKVISDYITSLNIFDGCIELNDVNNLYNPRDIFIFGQMWMGDDLMKQLSVNPNAMFLNIEMLSETQRYEYILKLVKHNITILDYSIINVTIINDMIKKYNICYTKNAIYLPYQFNKENKYLKNITNEFEYDIGIINAIPNKIQEGKVSRRTALWNKLLETDWTIVNIMGWGQERDNIIKNVE